MELIRGQSDHDFHYEWPATGVFAGVAGVAGVGVDVEFTEDDRKCTLYYSIWWYMAVYGGIWRYMAVYDDIWAVYGRYMSDGSAKKLNIYMKV